MSTETQPPLLPQALPPPKFSRYRSVRQAKATALTSHPPFPSGTATTRQHVPVARSPSRYHKKARSADAIADATAGQRVLPPAPLNCPGASPAALTAESSSVPAVQDASHKTVSTISAETRSIARSMQGPTPSAAVNSENLPRTLQSSFATDLTASPISKSETDVNKEAREKLRAEQERIRRIKAKQRAAREFENSTMSAPAPRERPGAVAVSERDAPEADIQQSQGAEPAVDIRGVERTQGQATEEREEALAAESASAADGDTMVHGMAEGRREGPATAEMTSGSRQSLSPRRKLTRTAQTGAVTADQPLSPPVDPQPSVSDASTLERTDAGPVSFDMPRSAVNAGERSLVVKHNDSVICLPVTPTTTSQDVLNSASTMMSNRFAPQHSLLLESFTPLGLERPLRKYEHVRDIMNSWDYDTQNCLVIMPLAPNVLSRGDVDARALPKRPSGTSLYMYHSQRPGKWDKRWISLRDDGQVFMSKRQGGSEGSSLCHLSDFDIYKPTKRQIKKLKPPKKTCFAIKSQQKSAMFLNGADFVHFFATDEGPVTETWYSAVRTWRSWYLVNVLGAGQEQGQKPFSSTGNAAAAKGVPDHPPSPKRTQQPPSGPLGTASPTGAIPKAPSSSSWSSPRRDVGPDSVRGPSVPPSSFPRHQIHLLDQGTASSAAKSMPSLTRDRPRSASVRSDAEATNLRRSPSLSHTVSARRPPKPLLDLTPEFQEQPQHLKKGRGVAPIPGMPLVVLATDVEPLPGAISIPAARAWQRPQEPKLGRGATVARSTKAAGGFGGSQSDDMAFTGTGLLSRSKSRRTQGSIGHGYGLKTGDRNHIGEPLVDLIVAGRFADGSLLRPLETIRDEVKRGLVVDRAKRSEADVSVGEDM